MGTRFGLALALCGALVMGCGGDDDSGGGTPDAASSTPDASGGGGSNALGVRCGPGNPDCPAGHSCVIQPIPMGSTMQGYCSPDCQTETDCTDGYSGPGSVSCFSPPACSISCSTAADCPADLTCLPTGGPTLVCAVEQGSGGGGGGGGN